MTATPTTLTETLTGIAENVDKAAIAIQWFAEKDAEKAAQVAYLQAEEERKLTGEQAAEVFEKDELVTIHGNRTVRFTTKKTGQAPAHAILAAILPTLSDTQREIYDAHMRAFEDSRGEAYAFAEPTAAQRKALRNR